MFFIGLYLPSIAMKAIHMIMHTLNRLLPIVVASCVSVIVALSCSGCKEKQSIALNHPDKTISAATTLLVTLSENNRPPDKGADYADQVPQGAIVDFFFSENGKNIAYSVRDYGYSYVSHNGKLGKVYKADVESVVLSADGNHIAFAAPDGTLRRMVLDGVAEAAFTQFYKPQFSPDGRHLAYSALKDGSWGLVVDRTWHGGKSAQREEHLFSGDSSQIAFIDEVTKNYAGRLVVTDLKFRNQKIVVPAGVLHIVSNDDKTRVAAIVSADGKQKVISFSFANPGDLKTGPAHDSVSNLVYAPDGVSVVYTAEKAGTKYVVLNDREEILGDANLKEPPVVRPDLKGVGVIIDGKDGKSYMREFFIHTTKAKKSYDGGNFLTYSKDGVPAFAAASEALKAWFIVVGGKEGPPFDRVVEPRFSPDGKYLVYRARQDGKRFVVVADTSGKVLRQHPAYEQVFDVQFTADGKSVAYGVKDGRKLIWKVEKL